MSSSPAAKGHGGLSGLRSLSASSPLPVRLTGRSVLVLALAVMIGIGIFNQVGLQATTTAGPAVIVAVLVGVAVCWLAALNYAELSSALPYAGGGYTFARAALGPVTGWLVGWVLILQAGLMAAILARLAGHYLLRAVTGLGIDVPPSWPRSRRPGARPISWARCCWSPRRCSSSGAPGRRPGPPSPHSSRR